MARGAKSGARGERGGSRTSFSMNGSPFLPPPLDSPHNIAPLGRAVPGALLFLAGCGRCPREFVRKPVSRFYIVDGRLLGNRMAKKRCLIFVLCASCEYYTE